MPGHDIDMYSVRVRTTRLGLCRVIRSGQHQQAPIRWKSIVDYELVSFDGVRGGVGFQAGGSARPTAGRGPATDIRDVSRRLGWAEVTR